jgi:hypothetical protein
MADWHLSELDEALRRVGWTIEDVRTGDGYRTSAVWSIARGSARAELVFEGLTEEGFALPIERAYACRVEGTARSLYFGRKTGRAWRTDLADFVASLP